MDYAQRKPAMLQQIGGTQTLSEFHAASHDEVEEGLGVRDAGVLDSSDDGAVGNEFDSDASADFSGDDDSAIHVMV